jgi:uncharacterized protein YbjT (DUF2867 family)
MKKKLLVTGGSGTRGSAIINQALKEGRYEVSTISTDPEKHTFPVKCRVFKSNLATAEGLKEALNDVQLIIHCASSVTDPQHVDFDGTANLIAVLGRSVFENLVFVSIVGIDHTDHPYYMMKLKVEQLIAGSGIPYSILRATQFHEYVIDFIKSLKAMDHEINVPSGLKFQTIAVPELAEILLAMLPAKASGAITTVGGPEIMGLENMAADYLNAIGSQQQLHLVDASQPREFRFRTGANLAPDAKHGQITWARFLEGLKR